jgi:uncharacterized membrane protein (GlpM family)
MTFVVKLLVSNLIIVTCVLLGKRFPALAGLIATMPITTLIVLLWLAAENPGDSRLLATFTGGVFWGIIPTLLFFAALWLCLRRGFPLAPSLAAGCAVWMAGALTHQLFLR